MGEISKNSDARRVSVILVAVLLQGAGQTALLACLPLLNVATGAGYPMLTAALSASMVMVLFSAPFWGARSDRLGRLIVIRIALMAMAISNLFLAGVVYMSATGALAPSAAVALIFLSRIVYGVFIGGLYPAAQAYMLDSVAPDQQGGALSRISAAINLGRLLGPLGGFVAVYWDVTGLLLILGLAPVLLLILAGKENQKPRSVSDEKPLHISYQSLWQLCAPIFVMAVFVTGVFGVLQFSIGPLLQERLQLSPQSTTEQLSFLMMVMSLITLAMHVLCARFMGRHYLGFLRVGVTLLLVGCFVLVQAESMAVVWIGLSLAAASVMLMTPAYTALAAEQVHNGRGKLTGLLSMMHSAGYALGGMVAGAGMVYGINLVMFGALGLALILFLIATLVVDSNKNNVSLEVS